jgi:hypothetical protein
MASAAIADQDGGDEAVLNCIWVQLSDTALARAVTRFLRQRYPDEVVTDHRLPAGSTVGFIITDDSHAGCLGEAEEYSAGALQSILITIDTATKARADFVLKSDVDLESVRSVFRAAREFRDEVLTLRADVAKRKSAIGTINYGQFIFRTLDEARSLSTMLALACPEPDLVVVGLQELMINAVEHGNLEISAEEKQSLLMRGAWRDEIEKRLMEADFIDRVVIVTFQRSERIISITIQDEGLGFDHEAHAKSDVPSDGYRGRGIAMARDLSFSSVTYMGAGNIVEATIMLEQENL